MAKIAIVMMSADDYPEGRGRMAHVMTTAEALMKQDHEVKILFHGQGVSWLETWNVGEHPFTKHYRDRFERIRSAIHGACNFCTTGRFKVAEHAEGLDVPLLGDDGGHDDLAGLIGEGYQVITF